MSARRARPARLGATIRAARGALGVSRAQLAVAAKVSVGYLGAVETDLRTPSAEVLQRIATKLDLDLNELLALAGRLPAAVERLIEQDTIAVAVLVAMVGLAPKRRRQVLVFAEGLARSRTRESP